MFEDPAGNRSRRLIVAVMAALLFAVIYFYFVKDYSVGIPGNSTNAKIFTSASSSSFLLDDIYDVWKGRFLGLLLSGFLFDTLVHHSSGSFAGLSSIFGLYQAGWLLLLFLLVILATSRALVINTGIFLGVMYNLIPAGGLYFYPWDIPATVFFTLAVVFFESRRLTLMLLMIAAGCFFKETVLVCAPLVFFVVEWKWWRRILTFGLLLSTYVAGKTIILTALHAPAAAFSMSNATKATELFNLAGLQNNLDTLCSGNGIFVLFANAGTLAAVLMFGWQRRFWPYMCLILIFLAGQALYGAFIEFRIFMQVLPVSLFVLWKRWSDPLATDQAIIRSNPHAVLPADNDSWPARKFIAPVILPVLVITAGLAILQIIALGDKTAAAMEGTKNQTRYQAVAGQKIVTDWFDNGLKDLEINQGDKTALEWFKTGAISMERKLANLYQLSGQTSEAIAHYSISMAIYYNSATNSPDVENNLAWFLSSSPDGRFRDGKDAVRLARDACEKTGYQIPVVIGTLANAYAEDGQSSNAVETCQKTIALAAKLNQADVVENNQTLLKLYESGKAFHEEKKPTAR
jgi:hypothetical protein